MRVNKTVFAKRMKKDGDFFLNYIHYSTGECRDIIRNLTTIAFKSELIRVYLSRILLQKKQLPHNYRAKTQVVCI